MSGADEAGGLSKCCAMLSSKSLRLWQSADSVLESHKTGNEDDSNLGCVLCRVPRGNHVLLLTEL